MGNTFGFTGKNKEKISRGRVAIIHPDMGIGGAEQLMLNLAIALQTKGFDVTIFTPRFDPGHCFQELKDGKVKVEVHGGWFPRHIFNKFNAFCAYIRMLLCTLYVILFKGKFQLISLDQVPLPIPFIRVFTRAKILFYCHYPDKLLCVERASRLKRIYRWFIDTIEEHTMAMAHGILVNSNFTKTTFYNSFPVMARNRRACLCCCKAPKASVLYPAIDEGVFKTTNPAPLSNILELDMSQRNMDLNIICTLNRYERKKNLALAIEAFAIYLQQCTEAERQKTLLIVAGGYDEAVRENVEHYRELVELAQKRGISDKNIRFLRSISNAARTAILQNSKVMLYTPSNEHFGIVPLEAMYNKCAVLACNSGGPRETVLDGRTGYLLDVNPEDWANKIRIILQDPNNAAQMGEEGQRHVKNKFTIDAFGDQLEEIVDGLLWGQTRIKTSE